MQQDATPKGKKVQINIRAAYNDLCGGTDQKIVLFPATLVRTANPTVSKFRVL
jgi:hypothetical protein